MDPIEAAAILRRILEAVEEGDLSADTPREKGMIRQIEGAAVALEALTTKSGGDSDKSASDAEDS